MTSRQTFDVLVFQHSFKTVSAIKYHLECFWCQLIWPLQLTNHPKCRHAVLWELAHKIGCRGIFSTHYHRLATEHATDPTVRSPTSFFFCKVYVVSKCDVIITIIKNAWK